MVPNNWNISGPLGIHVVPCNDGGRLVVQGIEPGGRVDRDGRLAVGDEIIEINGYSLAQVGFNKAQEIFREALFTKDLVLQVYKGISDVCASAATPASGGIMLVDGNKENEEQQPAAGSKVTAAVQANNKRTIGRMLRISLTKGPSGLGFSITTRDNAPGGKTPVYIKNIMPKGAAIEEGSLKPGDRLLEVGGVSVDGMSQAEVVALLRNAEPNAVLELVVSRHGEAPGSNPGTLQKRPSDMQPTQQQLVQPPQEEHDDPEPRSLSPEDREEDVATSTDNYESYDENYGLPWKQREILTFDIPVHDSERAGLGVSVKGKTSQSGKKVDTSGGGNGGVDDLGIFVKSVIHGGAASRDGRLRTNDQLVNINGHSLIGKPNPQAMETLRKAMHEEGPVPGIISLTVARRKAGQSASAHQTPSKVDGGEGEFRRGGENRDSMSSQVTSSSDDLFREYNVSRPRFVRPDEVPPAAALPGGKSTSGSSLVSQQRNPVIDRLMGKESAGIVPSNIRNESYYMATHQDTWNATQMKQHLMMAGAGAAPPKDPLQCPTVHQGNGESLMIEQEGIGGGGYDKRSTSTLDGAGGHHDRSQGTPSDSNATRESLTSLIDGGQFQAFARDQPGRQSMSEKRHATLDAKATDTYQKRKKARDEMLKQKNEQHRVTWKKSASVESLHTATGAGIASGGVGFLTEEEREALKNSYVRANSVRVSRNRGCNESFRQAVDRSYEGAAVEGEDFEIEDDDDDDEGGSRDGRIGGYGSGTASAKKKNKLLRNFGAMFRLGSGGAGSKSKTPAANRKSVPLAPSASSSSMPQSQSVPDYKAMYAKSRSGPDLAHSATTSEFARPYPVPQNQQHPQQQQQQEVYEYLPSSMMRPGSRVGIADPAQNTGGSSDYEVMRHLMHRSKNNNYNQQQQQQYAPQQQQHPYQQQPHHDLVVPRRSHHHQQHQQHPQSGSHLRSHSNPARPRPKSNFYEYDTWSAEQYSQPPPQQQHHYPQQHQRRPVPPQKPSERSIQNHFSTIAATDPYLYSAGSGPPSSSMPPPPPPGMGYYQQQQPSMRQQQQHPPPQYLYGDGGNLAMVHQHRPSPANLPKMS